MNGSMRVSALLVGMLACSSALAQAPAYSGIPQRSLDPVAAAVTASIKQAGNDYNDLRPLLLQHGWKPVVDKQCLMDVLGGDAPANCAANPKDHHCHICDTYPELATCGSGSICLMRFNNPATKLILKIGTYGDIFHGEAVLQGWRFDKTADGD